ncbi:MAG: GDP-L-fucose synthase [Bacteroidetes bacterium]|nr:GDP-L-fucose synthase [Bacteroidota bacterium]
MSTVKSQKSTVIYIAGHNGMVGSAVWRALEAEGYTNLIGKSSKELDLKNQAAVEAFFQAEKPDYVIDAAARVGGILANNNFPYAFLMENMLIQNNLIDAAHRFNCEKFIFLGSSCIYPKLAPQPLKEDYLLTDSLEPTNEWYAIAKISGVKACEAIRKQFGKDFVSLMPTNLYGPNDNFDLESSHVLPAMMRKFHEAKFGPQKSVVKTERIEVHKNQEASSDSPFGGGQGEEKESERLTSAPNSQQPVTLWGSGTPMREFLHVDDLAKAVLYAVENVLPDNLYNVGTGQDVTIKQLAETIQKAVGHTGEVIWDSTKPDGTPRKLMDVSKMQSLGWKAEIGLEVGIQATYEWFLNSEYKTLRY